MAMSGVKLTEACIATYQDIQVLTLVAEISSQGALKRHLSFPRPHKATFKL